MRSEERLQLPPIPTTSPSLAESMRACLLRAGLTKAAGVWAYVLGHPKAWLGTAYHGVLERLPELNSEEAMSRIQELWREEIGRLEQQASRHALNRRFGPATTWRAYYLVLETLKLRAANLVPAPRSERENIPVESFREEEFIGFGGKLKGKPDLGRGDEIIDFKTGNIYESSEDENSTPAVKQAYIRQLRIYAYLVHQATGRWPRRALLYPIAGPPVEVDVDPAACLREANEAVALLDRYNDEIAKKVPPASLASPSQESCQWCPFKILCPAFWTDAREGWKLDGDAISGVLVSSPQPIYGGDAYSLSIRIDGGTVNHGTVTLASFPNSVHPNIALLTASSRIRLVGLTSRASGTPAPSIRTVVFAEDAIPLL